MKIYLDVDETILNNDYRNIRPANYLKEFLENILSKHDVYWLTTHCDGDASVPVWYLRRYFSEDLINLVSKIKPTSWKVLKIEAINLDEDFMWFDDTLMQTEEKMLREKGKLDSFVLVDIDKNPDFFKDYLEI